MFNIPSFSLRLWKLINKTKGEKVILILQSDPYFELIAGSVIGGISHCHKPGHHMEKIGFG